MTATLTRTRPVVPPGRTAARTGRREYILLAVLLIGTAAAYLWNLSKNGWANSFYAAAVQAGSVSWKAFFFGSSDAANSITVDKTPLSLWPMEISVRVFGLHSWSMLLPQALLGVASVALLWATVRRTFGGHAGLLAGLVLAVTPIAAVMFRFNNPDAVLVFLMIAATWAMTRAVADGRWRWLLLTGVFIGLGFLAKQLQVLLVVPALALTYLLAGPPKLGKRILQLFGAGFAMIAGAGWWVLIAELWPVADRPYFGGSQNNSIIELTLGYNGLGRLNGNEHGSVGGDGGELPPGGNGMWGTPGIGRLFEPAQAGQIAWLIPAALVLLIAGIVLRGKLSRIDPQRATLIVFGGWLLVTGLVFSFMKGIFHPYYTVALAPAVAALIGAGSVQLWQHRDRIWVRLALAVAMGLTTATAWIILSRSESFVPWLRWVVLIGGIATTLSLLIRLPRTPALAVASLAVLLGLAGPVAYAVDGLNTSHQGPMPSAGPAVRGGWGPGGHRPGGMSNRPGGNASGEANNGGLAPNGPNGVPGGPGSINGGPNGVSGTPNGTNSDGYTTQGGPNGAFSSPDSADDSPNGAPGGPNGAAVGGNATPGSPSGAPDNPNGVSGSPSSMASGPNGISGGPTGTQHDGGMNRGGGNNGGPGGFGGPAGGVMGASNPSAQVTAMLEANGSEYTWVAATVSSNSAAGFQLATQLPVMPIGGFNGSDPSPTLAQFQEYVQVGRIHYFIAGSENSERPGMGGGNSATASSQITAWVKEHFTSQEVDGITLYDLTSPKTS